MKRILLFLLLQVTFLVCFADEYIDPVSNVIYTYNPSGNRAEVKQGEEWIDTDDGQSGWSQPGSPNAKTEIVILERFTVDGKEYVVDKIGDYAFFQMKNITSIVIPSSVKTIGCNAFKECSALSCVVINNGLTSINELAFAECESLESISLPETLKEIGPKAFHSCTSLTFVIIPEGVTNISNHAFAYCDNLEDIYCRAESVPTTDVEAFFGTPIASATLHVPEGSIEKYKATSPWKDFGNIVALGAQYNVNAQELTVSDIQNSGCLRETRETRAGDDDELEETRSIILTKEGNTLKVQLLNYIDNCGIWGFDVIPYVSGGSNGEPYTVSISVKSILGFDQAACICPYNVSFTLNGLETNSFNFSCYWCEGVVNLTEGEPLVIEDSWDDIGVNGLNYKIHKVMHSAKLSDGETWEGELNIPSELNYEGQKYTVTSIDDNAFVNNTALTSVTIPSSVISIGYGAFKGCRNLANITIPNSVIWIDTNAFNNTAWYNNQPDGVVYAGRIAYKCKGTMPEGTNITIKEGTYAIAHEAFHNCNGLASVTIPGSVTIIGDRSFRNCSNLKSVTISDGVMYIGEVAFRDCSSLESITIPKSIIKIADGAFWGCKSLASVNLSEGLTRMGIFVFADCPSLSSITIPGSLANAREYTFTGCTNLTSVVFSEGVKSIEQSIFFHCNNLSTISIPKSIKSIYGYVFSELSNLADFYCFADSVPKITKEAFFGTPIASATLHVPAGSIEKYKTTSPWKDFGNIVALDNPNDTLHNHPKYYQDGDYWVQALVPWDFEERIHDYETEGSGENFSLYCFYVEGDTIIDNKEYKCVHAKIWYYDCEATYDHQPEGLIEGPQVANVLFMREDADGKQWRRLSYLTDEALLFDFSHPFEKGQVIRFCKHDHLSDVLENVCYESVQTKACSNSSRLNKALRSDDKAPEGYLYYNLEVSNVTTLELPNGEQVPFANGRIAFGWGDVYQGDLLHQFVPVCESFSGRFLYRVHQGQVVLQKQDNINRISSIIGTDVLSLFNKPKDTNKYFSKDQMATIILPTEPDASKGKYYGLDRCEEGKIIFTEELQPKARVPYIIVPKEDFTIDLSKLELESLLSDTVSVKGAMFIGSYNSAELNCQEGFYIDIIDSTPDCHIIGTDQRKAAIGALRAYLVAPWDDPYTQGPTKGIKNKREIVLQDDESSLTPNPSPVREGSIYDLQGRRLSGKPAKGLYIQNGVKRVVR